MSISKVFYPGAPISDRTLLVGRTRQFNRIVKVLSTRSRAVVITGTRGIGKTSLAIVSAKTVGKHIKTQCNEDTTFNSWALDVLEECGKKIYVTEESIEKAFGAKVGSVIIEALGLSGTYKKQKKEKGIADIKFDPNRLYKQLVKMEESIVITIDELDRIPRGRASTINLFGDFIKLLGDNSEDHKVSMIAIGVSSSAKKLFSGHPSTTRNVTPIHLQRISNDAIKTYFRHIADFIDYTFHPNVVSLFASDFRGFPHFVHLVGEFCSNDIEASAVVTVPKYNKAVNSAIDELLGIDTKYDFVRNKNTPSGDALLREVLGTRSLKIKERECVLALEKKNYPIGEIRTAIIRFAKDGIINRRGEYICLADPELSPFLSANYRRKRFKSSDQLILEF